MTAPTRTTTAEIRGSGSPTVAEIQQALAGLPGTARFTFTKVSDQRESSWKIEVRWNQTDEAPQSTTGPFQARGVNVEVSR